MIYKVHYVEKFTLLFGDELPAGILNKVYIAKKT
jgi:hypothetical protein